MAFPSVTQAVAKIVLDSKIFAVNKLVKFLGTKMEIDEDFNGWIEEFVETLRIEETKEMKETVKEAKKTSKKIKIANGEIEKKTRDPTIYNLYVKENMSYFKEKHSDITDGRVLRRMLGEEWKKDPMSAFLTMKVTSLKKKDNSLTVQEAYEQAKEAYEQEKEAWENGDHDMNNVKPRKTTKSKATKTKENETLTSVVESDDEKPKANKDGKPKANKDGKPKANKDEKPKAKNEVFEKTNDVSDDETLVVTEEDKSDNDD